MKLERLPKGTPLQVGDICYWPTDQNECIVTQEALDYWKSLTDGMELVQALPFYRQVESIIL